MGGTKSKILVQALNDAGIWTSRLPWIKFSRTDPSQVEKYPLHSTKKNSTSTSHSPRAAGPSESTSGQSPAEAFVWKYDLSNSTLCETHLSGSKWVFITAGDGIGPQDKIENDKIFSDFHKVPTVLPPKRGKFCPYCELDELQLNTPFARELKNPIRVLRINGGQPQWTTSTEWSDLSATTFEHMQQLKPSNTVAKFAADSDLYRSSDASFDGIFVWKYDDKLKNCSNLFPCGHESAFFITSDANGSQQFEFTKETLETLRNIVDDSYDRIPSILAPKHAAFCAYCSIHADHVLRPSPMEKVAQLRTQQEKHVGNLLWDFITIQRAEIVKTEMQKAASQLEVCTEEEMNQKDGKMYCPWHLEKKDDEEDYCLEKENAMLLQCGHIACSVVITYMDKGGPATEPCIICRRFSVPHGRRPWLKYRRETPLEKLKRERANKEADAKIGKLMKELRITENDIKKGDEIQKLKEELKFTEENNDICWVCQHFCQSADCLKGVKALRLPCGHVACPLMILWIDQCEEGLEFLGWGSSYAKETGVCPYCLEKSAPRDGRRKLLHQYLRDTRTRIQDLEMRHAERANVRLHEYNEEVSQWKATTVAVQRWLKEKAQRKFAGQKATYFTQNLQAAEAKYDESKPCGSCLKELWCNALRQIEDETHRVSVVTSVEEKVIYCYRAQIWFDDWVKRLIPKCSEQKKILKRNQSALTNGIVWAIKHYEDVQKKIGLCQVWPKCPSLNYNHDSMGITGFGIERV